MPKVLRCNMVLLISGTTYRKKTNSLWELEEEPRKGEGILYYEDIRPTLNIH